MAKQEIIKAGKEPSTGPYSAGIKCNGFVFVSGQGPLDPDTGEVVRGTVEEQTKLTLEHVDAVLKAAGCTRDDVVKSTVHLLDIKDFDAFNKAYMAYFTNRPLPARTTVESVLWSGILVEIDVVAVCPD